MYWSQRLLMILAHSQPHGIFIHLEFTITSYTVLCMHNHVCTLHTLHLSLWLSMPWVHNKIYILFYDHFLLLVVGRPFKYLLILFSVFSAGVGRTGTFIALDIMLERIPQTHDVNVYECVQNMRTKRTNMVQTKVCCLYNVKSCVTT